jgi:hypothetical protein
MTRRTMFLLLVVEETDDDSKQPPSLPPFPVVEASGEAASEPRPLAKALPANVVPFRKAVGS